MFEHSITCGHRERFFTLKLTGIIITIVLVVCFSKSAGAEYSIITESEGVSCMDFDKTRRETERGAYLDAVRRAEEYAANHVDFLIRSQEHFVITHDAPSLVARASSKQKIKKEWFNDGKNNCVKAIARAEISEFIERNPWSEKETKISLRDWVKGGDSGSLLNLKVWTDKKEYRVSERIKISMQANRDFYLKVVYIEHTGRLTQLIPNPARKNNRFSGLFVHRVPSPEDSFEIMVDQPSPDESFVIFASSMPLGDFDIETEGALYRVKTPVKDLSRKAKDIKLNYEYGQKTPPLAEFIETRLNFKVTK